MRLLSALCFLSLVLAGCSDGETDVTEEGSVGDVSTDPDAKNDALTIPFTVFTDDTSAVGQTETRKLFTSASAYTAFFGHAPPSTVSFGSEWVVFYSAGVKPTGGYTASIARISRSSSGTTLKVTTSLESAGSDCFVTEAFTRPNVLVKFKRLSPRPSSVRFYRADTTHSCTEAPTCLTLTCRAGYTCMTVGGQATCAPVNCPGAAQLDASTGKCLCTAHGFCIPGYIWSSDPGTCGSESQCTTVRCAAGSHCDIVSGRATCVVDSAVCASSSDCRKEDNYCGGCNCLALGPGETGPTCTTPVACFAEPCAVTPGSATCVNGKCVLQ
jgi:hypothetical protein